MERGGDQAGEGAAVTEQPSEQERPPAAMGGTTSTSTLIKKKKLRVMAAIDDSEDSFNALEWAVEHLRDLLCAEPETGQEGGLLTLVHVQTPYLQYVYPGGGTAAAIYTSMTVPESERRAREESATALFTRAFQICRGKKVKSETLILEGDPKDMICQAAEKINVDLLVVGSRGRGMIKRALLGSVSDYCAHYAKCPVLIVKPQKKTATGTK